MNWYIQLYISYNEDGIDNMIDKNSPILVDMK